MDRLRQLWNSINAQLSVLSVSQRLAVGLCAALAVVSLLWLMQWSTTPEMVPLVSHDFSFDDLAAAEQSLEAKGIHHVVQGMRIFVPAADRHNALRLVNEANALPDGSLFDMDAIVQENNPFQSPQARAYAQTYAKGNELAKIIATAPFVKQASVILNPATKRRLGGRSDVPTASVTVMLTAQQEMSQSIVEGFAKLVAGAVAGLKPYDVFITDARTLRSYSLPRPDDATAFDVLTMVKRREEHYRSKILTTLADIPGVRVAVTVDLDMTKRVTQNVKHDAPEPKIEKESLAEQAPGSQPTEPGVQPNLGQAVTTTGAGKTNSTEERTTENFEPNLSRTETIEQMPFAVKKVTAVVGIPRSFVVGLFRARNGQSSDVPKDDDPAFSALRDAQAARVKASVERIVMAKNPADVRVDVFPDMEWTAEGGVWSRAPGGAVRVEQGAQGVQTALLLHQYGPQAGLATLALFSLFMMMRIVRKSSEIMAQGRRAETEPGHLSDSELLFKMGQEAVGQAAATESLLAGREVDPETLRVQEIRREVSKMVSKDPEGSADIIRRWIQES